MDAQDIYEYLVQPVGENLWDSLQPRIKKHQEKPVILSKANPASRFVIDEFFISKLPPPRLCETLRFSWTVGDGTWELV